MIKEYYLLERSCLSGNSCWQTVLDNANKKERISGISASPSAQSACVLETRKI